MYRKIGRRKLVPYHDRAQIEDGAIAGRGLELCWLKSQTDLLFAQIQGSARIKFDDGTTLRINYDAHNGYPYTPVGRVLIERGIIPKDQMSMQKIRSGWSRTPTVPRSCGGRTAPTCSSAKCSCPTRTKRLARRACR